MKKMLSEKSYKEIIIRPNGSKRVVTHNLDTSKTDDQWKDDSDINSIMEKFRTTGRVSHLAKTQMTYADVSQITDLQGAALLVREAQQNFDNLPSKIKDRFRNSVYEFDQFMSDPKNYDEAVKLGLVIPRQKNDDSNDEQKPQTKTTKKPQVNKKEESENSDS